MSAPPLHQPGSAPDQDQRRLAARRVREDSEKEEGGKGRQKKNSSARLWRATCTSDAARRVGLHFQYTPVHVPAADSAFATVPGSCVSSCSRVWRRLRLVLVVLRRWWWCVCVSASCGLCARRGWRRSLAAACGRTMWQTRPHSSSSSPPFFFSSRHHKYSPPSPVSSNGSGRN